jgi:hypothetical protein
LGHNDSRHQAGRRRRNRLGANGIHAHDRAGPSRRNRRPLPAAQPSIFRCPGATRAPRRSRGIADYHGR